MRETPKKGWYLERHLAGSLGLRRIDVDRSPFHIGREGKRLNLRLREESVSRHHAELEIRDQGLLVRDCGSTNGTFVNRSRIGAEVALQMGDILHLGEVELRVGLDEMANRASNVQETLQIGPELSQQFASGTRELVDLLQRRAVSAALQPIVEAQSGELHGHELLGRGRHPDLPLDPESLFAIAEGVGLCATLSEVFRSVGLRLAVEHGNSRRIFLNVHPDELSDEARLIEQLRDLRSQHAKLEMTIEIHEGTVVDLAAMARIREVLEECALELAYDDFGVGQARFMELVEVPPDYIKIDKALITGIDSPTSRQSSLVGMIIELARELEIRTLAEGVATEAEAVACRALGFDYLQGFHMGRPLPILDPDQEH